MDEEKDYDEDGEYDDIDDDNPDSPIGHISPSKPFEFSSESEQRTAIAKGKPPMLDALRTYNSESKSPVPGKKPSSEHAI